EFLDGFACTAGESVEVVAPQGASFTPTGGAVVGGHFDDGGGEGAQVAPVRHDVGAAGCRDVDGKAGNAVQLHGLVLCGEGAARRKALIGRGIGRSRVDRVPAGRPRSRRAWG